MSLIVLLNLHNRAINEIELDKYESSAMRVRKTYRVNVPKNLIINSCNLQLNDPVGQGMCKNLIALVITFIFILRGIWYCIQSQALKGIQ